MDEREIDDVVIRGDANAHNLAHDTFDALKTYRKSVEIKHSIRKDDEELTGESLSRSAEKARELEGANRVEKGAWKGVIATNRTLPNKLRGRHTR